ncbi:hypothetical protein GFU87_10735 [Lactococcus lactis subsp. lactis]|nr:hypothetical protein [Lactococcus lactis]MRK44879.1 hypothetical protein [Lactococcus lactis subsp. lactis]
MHVFVLCLNYTIVTLRFKDNITQILVILGGVMIIGGHMQGYKDAELSLRWLQFGVFSPINRLHSSKSEFTSKEP